MNIFPKKPLLNPLLRRPNALDSEERDVTKLWLDKNENLDPILNEINKTIMNSIPPEVIYTYPEAGKLYRKLGKHLNLDPNMLILTPGSDGAIRLVFDSFVEQGDLVIHSMPTFAMYPVYSQMFGAIVETVEYFSSNDGIRIDLENFHSMILKNRPKLVCLPNPDSPTGTILTRDQIEKILKLCERTGTVLLVDEAYHPFYNSSVIDLANQSENIIIARTFAKAWGAAGLRLGYAVAHKSTIQYLHKLRPMYEASSIAVEFAFKMLDFNSEMLASVNRILESKEYFALEMESLGYVVNRTKGNFIHIKFGSQSEKIHEALSNRVLYRSSFDHPSLKGYSRFSIGTKSMMMELVSIIKNSVQT